MKAANHASNVDESKLRSSSASSPARFALVRSADASANATRDSVLHLEAAYPDHAASRATNESRSASETLSNRSRD
jgi:hypothetical protein